MKGLPLQAGRERGRALAVANPDRNGRDDRGDWINPECLPIGSLLANNRTTWAGSGGSLPFHPQNGLNDTGVSRQGQLASGVFPRAVNAIRSATVRFPPDFSNV